MNWVFYLLIAIAVVVLWLILSSTYKKVGLIFYKLFKKAANEMSDEDVLKPQSEDVDVNTEERVQNISSEQENISKN